MTQRDDTQGIKMMKWGKDELKAEVEKALQHVAKEKGDLIGARIRSIVLSNLALKRVQTYLDGSTNRQPNDYIKHVMDTYVHWYPYVQRVQAGESEVWLPLFEQLQRWAYNFLRKIGFNPGSETFQLAVDYASEAGAVLINARFPFDTDFEPWAQVLLQNVCRKQIRKAMRSPSIPEAEIIKLDEHLLKRASARGKGEHPFDLHHDLLGAIVKLTREVHQKVILLYYFEGVSLKEIAQILERKVNSIYKLKYDALKQMGKILAESGYKYE